MMTRHNLKLAWRNLMKYKLQNTINILALAAGMVTLVAVLFIGKHMKDPNICKEPYFDRTVQIKAYTQPKEGDPKNELKSCPLPQTVYEMLKRSGKTEDIALMHMLEFVREQQFTLPDKSERIINRATVLTDSRLLHMTAYRSALTGEKIPILKKGEVVISDEVARMVFGDVSPVGCMFATQLGGKTFEGRIVDVIDMQTMQEEYLSVYYCNIETPEEYYAKNNKPDGLYAVLQADCNPQALQDEINNILEGEGKSVKVTMLRDKVEKSNESICQKRDLFLLVGGLIMACAIAAFLKIQVQLFLMRRRELVLRMVYGATFRRLYTMFAWEIGLTMTLAGILACAMTAWVSAIFRESTLMAKSYPWQIEGVYPDLFITLAAVFLLCVAVCGLQLLLMRRGETRFVRTIQRGGNAAVRNVMLGVNFIISLFFLFSVVSFACFIGEDRKKRKVPQNEEKFRQGIAVNSNNTRTYNLMREYLDTSAEHLESYYMYLWKVLPCNTLDAYPDLNAKEYKGISHIQTFITTDTAYVGYWNAEVEWLIPEEQRGECLLMPSNVYDMWKEAGALEEGSIDIDGQLVPVGGYVKNSAYRMLCSGMMLYITKRNVFYEQEIDYDFTLVPKQGKYDALWEEIAKKLQEADPKAVKLDIRNLRENLTGSLNDTEYLHKGLMLLCCISFLTYVMGIWSNIALDTRLRTKEMAIRKIHGAKRRHIALLFGRAYMTVFAIAFLAALPLMVWFFRFMMDMYRLEEGMTATGLYLPAAVSFIANALIIFVVVGYHIRKSMQQNPADIIAKE